MNEETLFAEALHMHGPARAAFLDEHCQDDVELRQRMEGLLRAADNPDPFLEAASTVTADEPLRESPGMVIGPYKLIEQIGEGGMGTVWMAQQTEPVKRLVALKLIKEGMDSKQVIARFEGERQALALMDHPNIAKVLEAGTTDAGRPYFVMDLVRGISITKYCDEHRLTPRQRLELFIPVCQAVQHAHQKGIIHRDIKPSNVLVALYDGKPVPKVIDFGVAKAAGQPLTEQTLVTGFGAIVGTLEYMSPEQAEINQLDIDTRSDIYSLGVLLYELLGGTTPLERKRVKQSGILEALRIIREEEAPTLSNRLATTADLPAIAANRGLEPAKLTRLVRGELDWIVMKALEKDRNRRYESANGFAMDVQRHLGDEPVLACPPSVGYRLRKFARRKKVLFMTTSVIVAAALVAVATLAISSVLVRRANQDLQQTLYFNRIALAHHELSLDNLHGALKYLEECPQDLRDWEWHYLRRLCRFEPMILRDTTQCNSVAYSPDGDRLASACGDGSIKIWNSMAGEMVRAIAAHADAVVSVVFHPDGRHLASRGVDGAVKVWDLTATGQAVFTEPCEVVRRFGSAYTVAFSADGRLLAAGTDGVVKVWDWKNRQLLQSLPGHNFHTIPVAFSGDGRLATGDFQDGPKLWNPQSSTLLRTVDGYDHPVSALAFSSDSKSLAAASLRTVKLLDATTGKVRHTFNLHTGNVECVALSPNGRRLASAGEDKTVRIWDAATGREVLGLRGHTDRCACVGFSPDGQRLASASADGTIRIWDGSPLRGDEGRQETLTFAEHTDEIRAVAFCPLPSDEKSRGEAWRIASAGSDGLVKVWDAQTGRGSAEFSGHEEISGKRGVVFCVAWHPKGHLIASAALDTVRVWDARTQKEVLPRLPAAPGKIALPYHAVAFSPDGRYLVTGKADGTVQVWDGETGQEVGALGSHEQAIRGVAFSKDGEHLASASSDGIVKLWDARRLDKARLDQKQPVRLILRARVAGPGLSVAFSPDGQRLATGGERNTVKVWNVQTGQEIRAFWGHKGDVHTLAFSPDDQGRWIASAGEDSTVRIWDSQTGALVRTFQGHRAVVSSLTFSSDGRLLVSGSRDYTVKVWDLAPLIEVPKR